MESPRERRSTKADDVTIPPNPIFLPTCTLLIAGWVVLLIYAKSLLVAYSFAATCIVWAVYRLPLAVGRDNLSDFFIYRRRMPRREFVGTLVTTNIGLFSSVAFSTLLIATMGIGPALIAVIIWIGGLAAFAHYVPRLIPFFRVGATVHEYIATSYGRSFVELRIIGLFSSVITFTLYIASVGVEVKYASDVFAPISGLSHQILAIVLCISGILYVAIAGYMGVVSTDRLRLRVILFGVLSIFLFTFLYYNMEPIKWPEGYFSVKYLTIGPKPFTLVSILLLLALYQFCVMDMWERCIAIVDSPDYNIEQLGQETGSTISVDTEIARKIKKMLVIDSFLPFTVMFAAWYSIGLWPLDRDGRMILPSLYQHFSSISKNFRSSARYLVTLSRQLYWSVFYPLRSPRSTAS